MGPVVTPEGTVALICAAEPILKVEAFTPCKVTAVAPEELLPVIVTTDRAWRLVGRKLVIVGGGMTVKLATLWPVPLVVVTLMGPVVAPAGTVAVICDEEFTVGLEEAVPLKATPVTLTKFAPVMTTLLPIAPLPGLNPLITGSVVTVKSEALWAVPFGVVTEIFPDVAPEGTVAVIWVAELTVNVFRAVPLNFTLVAPVKVAPEMVKTVPPFPLAGGTPVMAGLTRAVVIAGP